MSKENNVDIVNFTNTKAILEAEGKLIEDFIKKRKPVLNREGQDILAAELQALAASFRIVNKHFEDRIQEIKKLNKD